MMKLIKNSIVFVVLLFASTFCAQAQNDNEVSEQAFSKTSDDFAPKHEVYVAWGILSTTDWKELVEDFGGLTFGSLLGEARLTNEKKDFGNISVGYGYRASKTITLGLTLSYSQKKGDIEGKYTYGSSQNEWHKVGEKNFKYFTALPNVKFNWINKRHFGLYSRLGAGVRYNSEKETIDDEEHNDSYYKFAYQVSLIGVEFGSRHIRAFEEIGFGQCGLLHAGCRVFF